MKYKCLVLDHDDTVVMSGPTINYKSFLKTLAAIRPGVELSLTQFVRWCFEPGFQSMCSEIFGFSEEEMAFQLKTWYDSVMSETPPAWEGMYPIISRQKECGGLVCVVSHSVSDNILRDYLTHFNLEPDAVYGWELEEEQRKPHPYPLFDIMRRFSLKPDELIMIDDLKPGLEMARAAGVDFGWAGWSCLVPEIGEFMRENADYCFDSVAQLGNLLF